MKISFELLHTDKEIIDIIIKEFINKFNRELPRIVQNIEQDLKIATFNYLKTTSTYQSLLDGELAGHFGIPSTKRQHIIDSIIKAVSDSMMINYKPIRYSGGKFVHGIDIRGLKSDMSELLILPGATIISEIGDPLPWLEWLLTQGDKIIIREYEIDFRYGQGRSGLAVMDETKGGTWRVPAEFSGTIKYNWLTEALNNQSYFSIIKNIIGQKLNGS